MIAITMNGIEYTPQKGDSPFAPQTESKADSTYSMSPDVIAIVDLDLGNRSVTNDIENVSRKIEYYYQAPITASRLCTGILKVFGTESTGTVNGLPFSPCARPTRVERGKGF